ncbi:MAG: cytochrome c family protein [Bacteroidota bacterium]
MTSERFLYIPVKWFFLGLLVLSFSCNQQGGEETQEVSEGPVTTQIAKASPKKMTLGERTFILCQACHNLKEGEPHKVGPNLYGFLGQKAASKEGFSYSEALKNSGIVWNEDHLRNWMKKPTDYIPGTIMAFVGIEDETQQSALIEYLKEQTQ